jgi:hypothetical protein
MNAFRVVVFSLRELVVAGNGSSRRLVDSLTRISPMVAAIDPYF